MAASLRLLAREGYSRNVNYCLFFSRDPLAAGRSAGPLSGVATLAGPREGLSLGVLQFLLQGFQRTTCGWSECRSVERRRFACRSARGSLVLPGTGARDRTHESGGSVDPAGKRRSRVLMATRRCPPAQSSGLLLRQGFRPSRVPRTPGTRKTETKHTQTKTTHEN